MVDQIVLKKNYMRTLCVTHSIYAHLLTFITNDSVNYQRTKKNTLVHQTLGGCTLGTKFLKHHNLNSCSLVRRKLGNLGLQVAFHQH